MYGELAAEGLPVEVRILGVNRVGQEVGNSTICSGRDLPWLQDGVNGQAVWESWAVEYRDVVILDQENVHVDTYNLTTHDLGEDADYAALKALLRGRAGGGR